MDEHVRNINNAAASAIEKRRRSKLNSVLELVLEDLIALLCDLREDHLGTTLRVAAEIDGEASGVIIFYERPETDAEREQRLHQAERTEEWVRAHELRELARLKAKYEGVAA